MTDSQETARGLNLIAWQDFASRDDMYEIVDFLNKSMKKYNLMFGLRKTEDEKMTITIYEV